MAVKGCSAALYLGSDKVASLNSVTLNASGDTLDVTSFDSNCVREFIGGLRSFTIDFGGFYDSTDTNGQTALMQALINNTLLTTTQKPKILWDGVNGIEIDGWVSTLVQNATPDSPSGFSGSIQGTGTATII